MAIAADGYRFDSRLFGGQGIFGSLDGRLDFADGYFLGKALGAFLRYKHDRIYACITSDSRTRTLPLESEVVRGLLECGARVLSFSTSTTPLVRFAATELSAQLAISITGGSLPSSYNGIKIFLEGFALERARALQLQNIAASGNWRTQDGGRLAKSEGVDAYTTRLFADAAWLDGAVVGRKVLPTVIFAQSKGGAMGDILQALAERLAPLTERVLILDGLSGLREAMVGKTDQIGFLFNSDGTALQVFDSSARAISSETLFVLLLGEANFRGRRRVVLVDSLFSDSSVGRLESMGARVLRRARFGAGLLTTIGKERDLVAVAASDGHMAFMDRYYTFEDACYVALRFLALLSSSGGRLDSLLQGFLPSFGTGIIRVSLDGVGHKAAVIARLRAWVKAQDGTGVDAGGGETAVIGRDDGGGSDGESLEVERRFTDGRWIIRGLPFEDILLMRSEGRSESSAGLAEVDMRRAMVACGIRDNRAEACVGLVVD